MTDEELGERKEQIQEQIKEQANELIELNRQKYLNSPWSTKEMTEDQLSFAIHVLDEVSEYRRKIRKRYVKGLNRADKISGEIEDDISIAYGIPMEQYTSARLREIIENDDISTEEKQAEILKLASEFGENHEEGNYGKKEK